MDERIKSIIIENENADLHSLSLWLAKQNYPDKEFILRQIGGRKKVKYKIPAFYNQIEIRYPQNLSVEQSSSEITAKYKASLVGGSRFVDLTGGFGVDFAFISRKFTESIYVERQLELCEIAAENFKTLEIQNFKIINADSTSVLEKMDRVSLFFLDPHRRSKTSQKTVKISDCEPNLSFLVDQLVSKSEKSMVKLSPMLDIQQAIQDLKFVYEIHVVSVENECKELLVLMANKPTEGLTIKTINFLKTGQTQKFEFSFEGEKSAAYTVKQVSGYLYEPNASVLKAGAFRSVSERFNLNKMNINTHLYSSDDLIEDFPGRSFEILETREYTKNTIKNIHREYPKANITIRNFPVKVEEIRQKTKIEDGGEIYIFACKDFQDKAQLIICKKI